jgi:hypothetical protein
MNLYSTENGKTQESNEKIYIVDIPVIIGTLIKENGIEKIILESEIGIQEKTISKQEEILEKEIQDKNSIKKRKSEEELKNPSKTKRRKLENQDTVTNYQDTKKTANTFKKRKKPDMQIECTVSQKNLDSIIFDNSNCPITLEEFLLLESLNKFELPINNFFQ